MDRKQLIHINTNAYAYIKYGKELPSGETATTTNTNPLTLTNINDSSPKWYKYGDYYYLKDVRKPEPNDKVNNGLNFGELGICYRENYEKIYLRNSANKIVSFDKDLKLHKTIKVNTSLFNSYPYNSSLKISTKIEDIITNIFSNGPVYTKNDANKVLSVDSNGEKLIFRELSGGGGGGIIYNPGNGISIIDYTIENTGITNVKESTTNGAITVTQNNIERDINIFGLGSAAFKSEGIGSGLDADLLDGYDSSDFAKSTHTHSITEVSDLDKTLKNKSDITHTHPDATKKTSGFLSNNDKNFIEELKALYDVIGKVYIHNVNMAIDGTWRSIGIDNFKLLPSEGTYVVEFGPIGGNFGNSFFSAVIPWKFTTGNKNSYEELKLNMCGTRGGGISSFSARVTSNKSTISFQISSYLASIASQKITFKFRRIL